MWRFEDCPALMEKIASGAMVFFSREQSNALWEMLISSKEHHLMTVEADIFIDEEKYDVDFERRESADAVLNRFLELAGTVDSLILFIGWNSACILSFSLLKDFWNEIFWPSDETTIAIDVNSKAVLFSFEERFFAARRRDQRDFDLA
jgi:hypothetical protein